MKHVKAKHPKGANDIVHKLSKQLLFKIILFLAFCIGSVISIIAHSLYNSLITTQQQAEQLDDKFIAVQEDLKHLKIDVENMKSIIYKQPIKDEPL